MFWARSAHVHVWSSCVMEWCFFELAARLVLVSPRRSHARAMVPMPAGWKLCGVCHTPVRARCYMRQWPPERDHISGNPSSVLHHQALPSIADVEYIPGLKENMPVLKQESSKVKKKPAASVVKKPAASVVKKPAAHVIKKPSANVVKKPAAHVVKKPAGHVKKKPAARVKAR